jgi:hypothetical protein
VTTRAPAKPVVKDIRRATGKLHSSKEKIRIVLSGLRGEDSIAELYRKECQLAHRLSLLSTRICDKVRIIAFLRGDGLYVRLSNIQLCAQTVCKFGATKSDTACGCGKIAA